MLTQERFEAAIEALRSERAVGTGPAETLALDAALASTSASDAIIDQALRICRDKGPEVLLGTVFLSGARLGMAIQSKLDAAESLERLLEVRSAKKQKTEPT